MDEFIFRAKNITMEFSGVKALDKVDFKIRSGEIRAVVGINGAGKSTLMKVFSGVYPAYGGDIYCNGRKVSPKSPAEAAKLGIRIVHQEADMAILPDFRVYENLLIDDLAVETGMFRYDRKKMRQKAAEVLTALGIALDLDMYAKNLTLAQKQMLLIAKQIHKKCRLLILDEPTAALGKEETENLFRLVRRLSETEHTSVIFISHRLAEALSICQSCTVMCAGRVTDEFAVDGNVDTKMIVAKMLGKDVACHTESAGRKEALDTAPIVLETEHLCDGKGRFDQVSISVRKGEIVGLAGLVGAGKTEFCKAIFGVGKLSGGAIRIHGEQVLLKSPVDAVRHRIALVPEERRKEGIFPAKSITFHLCAASLSKFCQFSFLKKAGMEESARAGIRELGVSCKNEKQQIQFLSGGNQQKVVMGKWIDADCDIYILDEPMQGVDVGAKQDLFRMIRKLAENGAAVLYASSDVPDLLSVTDRIYAMYGGRIMAELRSQETEEKEVMYYCVGAPLRA